MIMFSMAIFRAQKLFVCLIELKWTALSQENVQFIFFISSGSQDSMLHQPHRVRGVSPEVPRGDGQGAPVLRDWSEA